MAERRPSQGGVTRANVISLPFEGRWLARNSPARRVPSHGTDMLGERYAIDFVGVDERRRTADRRDWRTFLATEPPERFFAFGRPILAPADGVIVDAHDGEIDHAARRSQLTLVPYALGQRAGSGREWARSPATTWSSRCATAAHSSPSCTCGPAPFASPSARGDGRAADRGLRQLRQLDPAARAHAAHGQPGPVRRPGRPDGVPALPRMASRREGRSRSGSPASRPRARSSNRCPSWRPKPGSIDASQVAVDRGGQDGSIPYGRGIR